MNNVKKTGIICVLLLCLSTQSEACYFFKKGFWLTCAGVTGITATLSFITAKHCFEKVVKRGEKTIKKLEKISKIKKNLDTFKKVPIIGKSLQKLIGNPLKELAEEYEEIAAEEAIKKIGSDSLPAISSTVSTVVCGGATLYCLKKLLLD